jgi:hypothetical protein
MGTALHGAINFDLACLDFALKVAINALIVEYVPALENAKYISIYFAAANRTLPAL